MDLEEWSVGGRGFGTLFVFLLMAGEIYSTFTFLGGAGFAYGSGGAAYYILGYGASPTSLSYHLLPAVWRYATPRRLVSQADVFVSKFDSRALACRRLGRRRGGDGALPRAAAEGPRDHRLADLLRVDLTDRGRLARRPGAVALRGRLRDPRLRLDGRDQGRADAQRRAVHRDLPAAALLRRDRRDVPPDRRRQARLLDAVRGPADARLVQLDRAAHRARLLHVAAHVRVGADRQGRERVPPQRRAAAALPAAGRRSSSSSASPRC